MNLSVPLNVSRKIQLVTRFDFSSTFQQGTGGLSFYQLSSLVMLASQEMRSTNRMGTIIRYDWHRGSLVGGSACNEWDPGSVDENRLSAAASA